MGNLRWVCGWIVRVCAVGLVLLAYDTLRAADLGKITFTGSGSVYIEYRLNGSPFGGRTLYGAPATCVTHVDFTFSASTGDTVEFFGFSASSGGIAYGGNGPRVLTSGNDTFCDTFNLSTSGWAAPPSYTNYIHCITWTNNLGRGARGNIQHGDGSLDAVFIGAGSVFSRCFTNTFPLASLLYVNDESVTQDPDDFTSVCSGNLGGVCSTTEGSVVSSPPTPGSAPTPNQGTPPWMPTNGYSVVTNAVPYYSPTNFAFGSGSNLTEAGYFRGVDAQIRANEIALDAVKTAIDRFRTNSAANGGETGVVDAINGLRNEEMLNWLLDRSNQLTFAINVQSNDWLRHSLTVSNADWHGSNGAYLMTNYGGSNVLGYYTATGEMLHTFANASWLGTASNSFGAGFADVPVAGSQTPLLVSPLRSDFPEHTLAVMDLRPSSWRSEMVGLCLAVRGLITFLVLALFYRQLWQEFDERKMALDMATAGTGKNLTGLTIGGAAASLSLRIVVATVVTVGLAGLPALAFGIWSQVWTASATDDPMATSWLVEAVAAASDASPALAAVMGALVAWVELLVPFGVMMLACVNYFVWRVAAAAFTALWMTVYRLLPVAVFFGLALGPGEVAQAATVIVDNRLFVPVSVLTDDGVEWYQPGERRVELPASFTLRAPGQGTNGLSFSVTDGELTRVIVRESAVTNTITGDVFAEVGEKWGFNRGLVVGLSLGLFVLVVAFVRKFLSIGFGGQSE